MLANEANVSKSGPNIRFLVLTLSFARLTLGFLTLAFLTLAFLTLGSRPNIRSGRANISLLAVKCAIMKCTFSNAAIAEWLLFRVRLAS